MPPILLCWPTTSKANGVDMAVEVEPSRQYSVKFSCRATDNSRGPSDKLASDMEVRMKQRCVIEFLHAEKIAPNDIHRRLLNVNGDQTVDVSTVRRWVARFSSGDSDVKDKPRSRRPCTSVTPRNEERLELNVNVHNHNTRRKMDIHIKSHRTNLYKNSVINMGSIIYNKLSDHLKEIESF